MKSLWVHKKLDYDGSQLRSLFGYLDHGVLGDSIICFRGACDVNFEHMVDGEDLLAQSSICADDMLHWVIEKFHQPLFAGVTLQRLFTNIVRESLENLNPSLAGLIRREGDDLFYGSGKLSVSIATQSPVSTMIHFGINISNDGTPVVTSSLKDLHVTPEEVAKTVSLRFLNEIHSIEEATMKVRSVR